MSYFFLGVAVVFCVWDFFSTPSCLRDIPSRCWKCGKELPPWVYHSRKECVVHRIMSS